MNRRNFIASLSTLVLPYEPKRIYSFGSDVGRVDVFDPLTHRLVWVESTVKLICRPDEAHEWRELWNQ